MNKKLGLNILRIITSVGLIISLLWIMRGSLGGVLLTIKKINKPVLLASFVFFLSGYLLLSIRFRFVMSAQHLRIALKEAASLTFIGQFFSNFLPTTVGGDLVKAYYTSKITGKKLQSLACVIFDRLLGTFTLILMMLITLFFVKKSPYSGPLTTFVITALIISLAVILLFFSRRIAKRVPFLSALLRLLKLEKKMKGIYDIIYNYKKHPRLIIKAVLISIALQLVIFYSGYLLIRGLNFYVPLITVFLLLPIITTVSMAPSINGLGVREGAFVILFGPLMTKEGAFALSILWDGLMLGMSLIGGMIYLFGKQYRIKGGIKLNDR